MPYGNKGLHFGHIGGVFVPADAYARFLRDRIGEENVLFVCGTDCYGSPINEGYRKLVEAGEFSGSIEDYVQKNHDAQVATLKAYNISCDIFEGSGIGKSAQIHKEVTDLLIRRLYDNDVLHKIATAQFFDQQADSFLNGRQVLGRCPVIGCKSEHAYADECDLGHQYLPADLINPISALSGQRPVMREVENWYFDLPDFRTLLLDYVAELDRTHQTRSVVQNTISEFLVDPMIYVKNDYLETYHQLACTLPPHQFVAAEQGRQSFGLVFASLQERDLARSALDAQEVRFRTGKTLVPFRITGNISWGVPAPVLEGVQGLTIWCWPESLWAPISFSRCWLEAQGQEVETLNPAAVGKVSGSWQDFWKSEHAKIYQFIGQDNIYFYGVAQTAMWSALASSSAPTAQTKDGQLQQSELIANYHLLFLDKKASSSGDIKPPMADELLEYYTVEQLRCHFLALGLSQKPVSFKPKPLDPKANQSAPDPVLKESALLTNIYNRLARSCFYEAQNKNAGLLPIGAVSASILDEAAKAILAFEQAMYTTELHTAVELASDYIRSANKYWSDAIKNAVDDDVARKQILCDTFYMLRAATVLMHPVVPRGTELIFEYLNFEAAPEEFFSWDKIFDGNDQFFSTDDITHGGHPLKELPPRFDFFEKHPSQL
jgi:methionyl-tRNA synthetase